MGNTWRVEMVNLLSAAAATPPYDTQVQLTIANVGNTPTDQIQSIQNMITSGVNAILIDATSPTALNPVIKQAVDAGIVVVAFDNTVTAPEAYNVNVVQGPMGGKGATWLCKVLNGKGNIIMDRGIAGTGVDEERTAGAMTEFAKCPGVKIVQDVRGNWDDATTESVMIQALTAHPETDAVWSEGIATGILNAIIKTKHKWIPVVGGTDNGALKMVLKYQPDGLKYVEVGNSPGMSAVAMKVAVDLLQGKTVPKFTEIPINYLEDQDLKAGVNVFPDLPDGVQVNWQVPDFNFTAGSALSGPGGSIK
jgi:ribose transport system substrate-binding protein